MSQGFEEDDPEVQEIFKNIKNIVKGNLKENLTNACRIGIGLYGLNHRYKIMKNVKPVLSLYTYVDKCSPINKNIKVGYNYIFKTPNNGYLILSPLGYGLGYLIRKKYQA